MDELGAPQRCRSHDLHTKMPDIYTIGHSNASAERVVGLLHEHGIETLVDVRSVPRSSHVPHFTRMTFAKTLADAGIRYIWMGAALGGRPSDPACYKDGQRPRGHANYLQRVDYAKVATQPWYKRGIRDLIHLARQGRTAIMCSEEDPRRCHRLHLVTQSLTAAGLPVFHIRHRGPLEVGLFDVARICEGDSGPVMDEEGTVMHLYTIGFAQKSAERFFTLLREHGVQRLVDIRLRPNGQLAGFTKQADLAYFLANLIGCEYYHRPDLAPTAEILSTYRKDHDWERYVARFEELMDRRNIPFALDRAFFEERPCCLLCSEPTPDQCHRRLVAERIARSWADTSVVHL